MTNVLFRENYTSPLDVLVKNFFEKDSLFSQPNRNVVTHPIDVFEDKIGLTFEVACTGIDKKDVNINIEGDILRVSYDKGKPLPKNGERDGASYYHNGIRKSSFNLGWKISRRFNLEASKAKMNNGLLIIEVPYTENSNSKSITIK